MIYIIYINGLGDASSLKLQRKAMLLWPRRTCTVLVFDANWHSTETYQKKYLRLKEFLKPIITGKTPTDRIVLIGVSAGGSLALRTLGESASYLDTAYFLAAKLRGYQSIGDQFHKRAPALREAVRYAEEHVRLDDTMLRKSTYVRSALDTLIPLKDTILQTPAKKRVLPVIGHTTAIALALLIYFPITLRLYKRKQHR